MQEQFENAPTSFRHNKPEFNGNTVSLSWQNSTDPNGDKLTYTLKYSKDPTFEREAETQIIQTSENKATFKKPESKGKYYWKVFATDGKYTVSGFDNSSFFVVE